MNTGICQVSPQSIISGVTLFHRCKALPNLFRLCKYLWPNRNTILDLIVYSVFQFVFMLALK